MRVFAERFKKQTGCDVINNKKAALKLEDAVTKTKKVLSANSEASTGPLALEKLPQRSERLGLLNCWVVEGLDFMVHFRPSGLKPDPRLVTSVDVNFAEGVFQLVCSVACCALRAPFRQKCERFLAIDLATW